MSLYKNRYRIESARCSSWRYDSGGWYFITICTKDRGPLFGDIVNDEMILSDSGKSVCDEWFRSAEIRPGLVLDSFVIMPNHLHAIIVLPYKGKSDPENSTPKHQPINPVTNKPMPIRLPRSVSSFIGQYKATVVRLLKKQGLPIIETIWQDRFYDHIIRNDAELFRIRQYIQNNPKLWKRDRFCVETTINDKSTHIVETHDPCIVETHSCASLRDRERKSPDHHDSSLRETDITDCYNCILAEYGHCTVL